MLFEGLSSLFVIATLNRCGELDAFESLITIKCAFFKTSFAGTVTPVKTSPFTILPSGA